MAIASYYSTGTASVDNAGTVVAGTGTAFTAPLRAGDLFGIHVGFAVPIASVDSDTQLTLAYAWPGATQSAAAYAVQIIPDVTRMQENTRILMQQLADGLWLNPGGTGNLTERAAYDTAQQGFIYMQTDVSPFVVYIKKSATSGDWSDATTVIGPQGDQGNTGERGPQGPVSVSVGTTTTGAAGSEASVTNSGDADDVVLDFTVPQGLDITWKGVWATGTAYKVNDAVAQNGSSYICVTAHTSGTFADDLTAAKWSLMAQKGSGDMLSSNNLSDVADPAAARTNLDVYAKEEAATAAQGAKADSAVQPGDLTPRYVGFYNGQSDYTTPANTYNIGVLKAADPLKFGRDSVLAPVWDDATTYLDSSGHQNPHPIRVGNEIWVYYEGYDGTRKRIFMLKTDLEGGLREKPLMPVIDYTAVAGSPSSIARPAVLYDPEDATWPFKMVFSCATTGNSTDALYSTKSADGFNWSTPVKIIDTSTGASWESNLIETTGRFLKDGSTYRLFYSGHNGTSWRSGEIYSTDFATWTKNVANPLLSPRGGYLQALTADANAGTKTLKVANSALFDVGAPIAICENGTGVSFQMNRIAAIPDGTTLSLLTELQGNYTTAISSCVSQITSFSVELSEVWFEDSIWKALVVGFQFIKSGQLIETMAYATSPDLNTPFTIQPAEWPLPLIEKRKVWDQRSAENLKFVRIQ